jgi:hypothetical protein
MNNFLFRTLLFYFLSSALLCEAQKQGKFNLNTLLKNNKLVIYHIRDATTLSDDARQGISVTGIVWLKDVNFSTGSIDADIRGRDVFQQSFLGIAFHGVDTITYDAIYFRPFNFQSADTLRKKHTVQYIGEPDYPWERLRKEHPLVYENAVTPSLKPTEWFHTHIVVSKDEIVVYVNHSTKPSLKVKKLNARNDGLIGLWSSALSGDFANLEISSSLTP